MRSFVALFVATVTLFCASRATASGLMGLLDQYYKVKLDPTMVVPNECLHSSSTNPGTQEACDHLFNKITIIQTHFSKNENAHPYFYETYEVPPRACSARYRKSGAKKESVYSCVFDALREGLKYNLKTIIEAKCLKNNASSADIESLWKSLANKCADYKKAGDFFSCFLENLPAEQEYLKAQFSEIARSVTEFDLLQNVCRSNVDFKRRDKACLSDEYLLFQDTIRNYDVLREKQNLLVEAQPGFELQKLPDYLFLFNECDAKKIKKKKEFAIHPSFEKQKAECAPKQECAPLSTTQTIQIEKIEATIDESLKVNPKTKIKTDITHLIFDENVASQVIHHVLDEALDSEDYTAEQKAALQGLKKDEKYIVKEQKHYVQFGERLRKTNIPDYKIALKVMEDYQKIIDQKMEQMLRVQSQKTITPKPVPTPEAQKVVVKATPNRDDLKSIAKGAIEKFKNKEKDDTDYFEFFSRLESDGALSPEKQDDQSEALKKKWQPYLEKYKKIAEQTKDSPEALRKIFKEINHDFLKDYVEANALLGDFFDSSKKKGGNCEARLRVLMSTLSKAKLTDIPGYKPVVQFYDHHVQFMLYNKDENILLDPVTGERVKGIATDLYDPRIVLHGYLKQVQEPLMLKDEDLIIAKADPKFRDEVTEEESRVADQKQTSSDLSRYFPQSRQRFSNGENPQVATTAEPNFDREAVAPTQQNRFGFSGINYGRYQSDSIPDGTLIDEVSTDIIKQYQLREQIRVWGIARRTHGNVIFGKKEDQERYKSLKDSAKDRAAFLDEIERQSLKIYLETPEYKELESFLEHPEQLPLLDPKKLESIATTLGAGIYENGAYYEGHWYKRDKDGVQISYDDPYRKKAHQTLESFISRLNSNPRPFFKWMSASTSSNDGEKKAEAIAHFFQNLNMVAKKMAAVSHDNKKVVPAIDGWEFQRKLNKAFDAAIVVEAKTIKLTQSDLGFLQIDSKAPKEDEKSIEMESSTSQSPKKEKIAPLPEVRSQIKDRKKKKIKFSPNAYVKLKMTMNYSGNCSTEIYNTEFLKGYAGLQSPKTFYELSMTCFPYSIGSERAVDSMFPDGIKNYPGPGGNRISKELALVLRNQIRIDELYHPRNDGLFSMAANHYGSVTKYVEILEQKLSKDGVKLRTFEKPIRSK